MVVLDVNIMIERYALFIQKLYWFAYLQLLWLLFTTCGLIIFGIFPATYALFSVWKMQNNVSTGEVFRSFRNEYFSSFIPLNKAGLIWQAMLVIISSNLLIVDREYSLVKLAVLGMLGLITLSIIHFFQYADLERQAILQIKRSFSLLFLHPRENVIYMMIFIGMIVTIRFLPGLSFFFGISFPVYLTVKLGKVKSSIV